MNRKEASLGSLCIPLTPASLCRLHSASPRSKKTSLFASNRDDRGRGGQLITRIAREGNEKVPERPF
ncbi:hypothetical protein SKAU_G00080010 [Synaphobranchus kaupii]|uniref:Uncharacterized protein n=1 Tax=Synaphobranchus kaupii TaxID=118154 RepID=A0A9Q1FUH0_SYNKA|nr:hypothetical protein SKAU_G00080010 [Synaphobranchus kaupii]